VPGFRPDQSVHKDASLAMMEPHSLAMREHRGTAEDPVAIGPMDLAVELKSPPSEGVLPFNASSLVSNKPVSLTCGESDDC
jgi:hypothetical protein